MAASHSFSTHASVAHRTGVDSSILPLLHLPWQVRAHGFCAEQSCTVALQLQARLVQCSCTHQSEACASLRWLISLLKGRSEAMGETIRSGGVGRGGAAGASAQVIGGEWGRVAMAMEGEVIAVGALDASTVKRRDNLKVRARAAAGVVASLRAQVRELEQQRDFLLTWKADTWTGADAEGSRVDVEFQGLDGDRVHAHKSILASKSNEFEAMFRTDTEGKVVWNLDMPFEALKAFITFFYTGRVSDSVLVDHFTTLLDAAQKYNVQFLALVCEDSLVKNVTRDNVITTFDTAKKHCSSRCKDAVLEKASRLGELSSFTEYKVLTQSNPGLLLELYEQLTDRPGQSPSKKLKLSRENDSEQPNNDNIQISEEDDIKSDTDEDESVDDEDVKTGTDPMPGPCMQLNGVSPFGTPIYWHGTPMPGHPFRPVGFESAGFPHPRGQRPPHYDMSMMPRPPYGIPAFVPPMFPGGMPRGFLRGAIPQSPGPPETPILDEVVAGKKKVSGREDPKKTKIPAKQQKEKRCLLRGVKTTHNKNKKFIATITVKGQHIVLGKCHSEEEAGRLYDRAAFVVGRKTNNELPDDMKEELKGISWDDFMSSLQEVTALEKIHQGKLENGDVNEVDYNVEQGEDQEPEQVQEQEQEQEQVLSDGSEHSSPAY